MPKFVLVSALLWALLTGGGVFAHPLSAHGTIAQSPPKKRSAVAHERAVPRGLQVLRGGGQRSPLPAHFFGALTPRRTDFSGDHAVRRLYASPRRIHERARESLPSSRAPPARLS